MKRSWIGAVAALLYCTLAAAAGEAPPTSWDKLVEIQPKHLDAAYLLPGADFRPYRKLMLDPVEIAFTRDWAKRYNRNVTTLSERLTDEDVAKIAAMVRDNFAEVFGEECRKSGFDLVTSPGADVLRVRAGVMDLYMTAPDSLKGGRVRAYTMESGEATLFLEARDSLSGALLGRALDHRATRNTGRAQLTNSVTNISDFRAVFRQWAQISLKGFEELRALSPVPLELEPGQKLQP